MPKKPPHKKRTTDIRGKGGWRPGAGRPKGSKTRHKLLDEQIRKELGEEGELPLAYMLRIMRDARYPKARRDEMAKAAAPYLHAKQQSVELKNKKGEALRLVSSEMTPKEAIDALMTTMTQPSFDDEEITTH
jgi:hypothetical protein